MTIASTQSGTLVASVTTKHALGGSVSVVGTYVLVVDLSNMVDGDDVTLEIQTKALPASSFAVAYKMDYSGEQSEPVSYSIPVPIDKTILCYLTQSSGTSRSFDWNLLNL